MDLRQLRYFAAVADELHFGRAAEKLHMSQPPLSVQIGLLERELGVRLFERSTRQVSLTPAGRHLRRRVELLLRELDDVRADMQGYADGLTGELCAGFVSSANYTVLPGLVQLFRSRRPRVDLTLIPLTSGEQIHRLRAGTLDVALVRDELISEAEPAFRTEVVYEELLVACVPADHPLARRIEVSPRDLIEVPHISYPRVMMPGFIERVAAVFSSERASPRIIEEVVHQETALGFIAAGVGVSVLPESVRQLVPPSIVVVPIAGSPTSRLIAAYPKRPASATITAVYVECLHQAAAALRGEGEALDHS